MTYWRGKIQWQKRKRIANTPNNIIEKVNKINEITLEIARKKFPGAQNSLDALCRRFNIDNSGRQKHGALLDSEILAEVYLELVGGRQPDFSLSLVGQTNSNNYVDNSTGTLLRPNKLKSLITDSEKEAHNDFIKSLGTSAMWNKK